MIICNWNSASFNQSSKWWCNPQYFFKTKTTFCKKIGPVVSPKKLVPLTESPWHPVAHTMKLTDRFFHTALMQKSRPSLGAAHGLQDIYRETQFPIGLLHDMCAIDI